EQTKKKLKKDPLLTIYKQKDVEIFELYAADHIRKAYQLITADVKMKSMKFEGYVDVFSGKPIEKEGELQTSLQHRYADWFDACTKRHIKVGPIIHILTEAVTFKDTDRYFTFRNGRTKEYVIQGLKLYVDMYKPRQGLEF
ncbi:MAG: hypothetical protein P8I94_10535, partial [Emcibacteraceae bacterium]|nr:hypothetical protein [Emcibacteraceae bacterium]